MPLAKQSNHDQNFVSQEQIDSLLKGSDEYALPGEDDPLGDIADFINTDEIDRLLGDDNPEGEDISDSYREDEMSDEPLPEDEGLEDEDLSMISMDDIQRVLSEDDRDEPEEALLEELNLNLEEISDAFDDDGSDGEGDLISQDDIDRLLKNSGVQADEALEEIDGGFQISREEMEIILTDTTEDSPKTQDEETIQEAPFILKEEEEELPPEKPRSKKKLLLMAMGFLLIILCVGVAGWFFLLRSGEEASIVAGTPGAGTGDAMVGALKAGISGESQVVSRLEHFLIPAPQGNDYAFVSMNVVITIRGVKTDPIKGYETFYRKRIYDEMTAKLALIKGEKPVQRELRELVRKTAGTILTEGVIDDVVLENYRLM